MASIKLSVDGDGGLLIENAFSGVTLKSTDGEEIGICMRDGGFEFVYNNQHYSAVGGELRNLTQIANENSKNYDSESGTANGLGE